MQEDVASRVTGLGSSIFDPLVVAPVLPRRVTLTTDEVSLESRHAKSREWVSVPPSLIPYAFSSFHVPKYL